MTIDPTITQPTPDNMLLASTENNDSTDKLSNSSATDAKLARSVAATLDDTTEQRAASNNDETTSKVPSSVGPKQKERTASMADKTSPISPKKSAATTPKESAMKKSTLSSPTAAAMEKLMSPLNKGATVAPEVITQVENEFKGTGIDGMTKICMTDMCARLNVMRVGTKQDVFDRLESYFQLVNEKDRKDVKVVVSYDGVSQRVATATIAPRTSKKKTTKSSEERPKKRKKHSIGADAVILTNDASIMDTNDTLV